MSRVQERLARLLLIMPYAMQKPETPVSELCERFGVSRRELMRDLEILFLCGLPEYGPGDLIYCYVEGDQLEVGMADYLARPVRLTAEEAFSLLQAAQVARALPEAGQSDALMRAAAKIREALAAGEGEELDDLERRVSIELEPHLAEPMLADLNQAIATAESVEISYFAVSTEVESTRKVDPYYVVYLRGQWYLLAWCHARGDVRVFRLDGIRALRLTGEGFVRREDLVPEELLESETLYQPSEADSLVRLLFSGPVSRLVREQWPGEKAEERSDGSLVLSLRTSRFPWLIRRLLQYGRHVRILEPDELRSAYLHEVGRLRELYERPTQPVTRER